MPEEHAAQQPLSAFTLFTKSKEAVLTNINSYAVLLLVPLAINIIASLSTNNTRDLSRVGFGGLGFGAVGVGAGLGLLSTIISVIVSYFVYALNLEVAKNKKPDVPQLWPTVRKYGWRLLGATLLIGIMFMCGLILLIVPGLIILRRYILTPYVMIDQDLSITAAMEESARISKPYSMAVWGVIGVTFLCGIVAIVPIIGWIAAFALSALYQPAFAYRYLELKKLVKKA